MRAEGIGIGRRYQRRTMDTATKREIAGIIFALLVSILSRILSLLSVSSSLSRPTISSFLFLYSPSVEKGNTLPHHTLPQWSHPYLNGHSTAGSHSRNSTARSVQCLRGMCFQSTLLQPSPPISGLGLTFTLDSKSFFGTT